MKSDSEVNLQLPPLTPETIHRAKEGLNAACNPAVQQTTEAAITHLKTITDSDRDVQVSRHIRSGVLRTLIHSLFRVNVEYPERIPQNAAILAPNHLNHLDPFLLLSEVPNFPYYYILGDARTLYNQWWKRRILKFSGGVIPLERRWGEEWAVIEAANSQNPELKELARQIVENVPEGGDIASIRQIDRAVQRILALGDGIILFPEGRLGTIEGQLNHPLKRGIALYALRSGVPIVPVAIIGTKNLYLWKRLTVRFGQPLYFKPISRPKRQDAEIVLETLEGALNELLPQNYQEPNELKLFSYFLNHLFY